MRTEWMFQVFMASTDAWSTGPPSHWPLPCTQAYSPLERSTPSSRYGLPFAVTILFPETLIWGAGPLGFPVGVAVGLPVGVAVGPVVGVTEPVQVTPLSAKDAG